MENNDSTSVVKTNMARRLLNATTSGDTNNVTIYTESTALRETLKTYGSTFLVLLAVFCFLQKKFPRFFAVRSWSERIRCDLALVEYGHIDWIWKVFMVDDDMIQDQCGMDALCFVRMLRFGRKLALVGSFNAIWLLPLYRIAENESPRAQTYVSKLLASISIVNLPSGSNRLVGTVVAAYFLFIYAMWLVLKEFDWYTGYRHRFLEKRLARNYAVYVSGIPEEYRSSHKLANYFRRCCAHETDVLEAHCTLNIPSLESKVAKSNAIREKIERTRALEELRGPLSARNFFGRKGCDIVSLQEELDALELEVAASRRLHRDRDQYLSGFQCDVAQGDQAGRKVQNEDSVNSAPNATEVHNLLVDTNEEVENNPASAYDQPHDKELSGQSWHASYEVGPNVHDEVDPEESKQPGEYEAQNGAKKAGNGYVKRVAEFGSENVSEIAQIGTEVVETAVGAAVTIVMGHEEGTPREAGFVVFTKLYAVHGALQMIHHPSPHVMEVSEAPAPDEIFWRNVGLTASDRISGKYVSLGATAKLCFFWSIPVTFISSLTQVNSLQQSIPFLRRLVERAPSLPQVLSQLAPLLLFLMNQFVLPVLLTEFSKWEGHIGAANLEASLFVKMSAFTIIQTFFVSAFSSSIAAELNNIIHNPGKIFELMANALPGQSSYFLQIILVATFTSVTFNILRVVPLIQAWLRTKIGPRITEKERKASWLGLHTLADPPDFEKGQGAAEFVVSYMVLFVYAPTAPITAYFLLASFTLLESVYRLAFFRNYPATSDSGGKLWENFIIIILVCMFFAQLMLIVFLALKKATTTVPLMIPLTLLTVLFFIFINEKHFKVAKSLPTSLCLELDRLNEEQGLNDFRFVKAKYQQSALQFEDGQETDQIDFAPQIPDGE